MKFLNSFNDLLLSENLDILFEGKLIASDRFLSKIDNIDNKVGEFLQSYFSDDTDHGDLPQNVIDTTDREDIITFMSDKAFSKLQSLSFPNKDVSDPEIFKAKGRSETRIGRFVRSLSNHLGQKFTDKEIEDFVNVYKASDTNNDNFKLVSGNDIKKYYNEDTYHAMTGILGNSCMKYQNCEDYFDIYTKNPNTCQMLVLFSKEGKVMGRSLVWKISKLELNKECSAEYFMDRVYSCKDSDIIKFRNYADSKGWIYRKKDNVTEYYNALVFTYKGQTLWGKIVCEIRPLRISEYPYVDTLHFLKDRYISNVGLGKDQKVLSDTEGGYNECGSCDNTGVENIDVCPTCDGDGEAQCPKCKCKKCNGGYIDCLECDGGSIQCNNCAGDGSISCNKCTNGYIDCKKCEGEGLFECKKCEGDGDLGKCKKCNGKDFICKVCDGKGEYFRKWGFGKRLVKCTECTSGVIKLYAQFLSKDDSTNRCDCYRLYYHDSKGSSRGHNSGVEMCTDCSGSGSIDCQSCDGDGSLMCEKCDGNGSLDCRPCGGNGSFDCEKCDGNGGWDCDSCDNGRLNIKCKCSDGKISCPECKGTGEPKNSKVPCSECVGLLDQFKKELDSGEYKLMGSD